MLEKQAGHLTLWRLVLHVLEAVYLLSEEREGRISYKERIKMGSLAMSLKALNHDRYRRGPVGVYFSQELEEARKSARLIGRQKSRQRGTELLKRLEERLHRMSKLRLPCT